MTSADLTSFVGLAAGAIGAITGIAGSIMGYLSLRRTSEIKALELRLELVKAAADVFHKLDCVGDLLVRAKKSRDAVAAATGMYHSGAREQWQRQNDADHDSLGVLNDEFDELNVDYSGHDMRRLETALSGMYALRTFLDGIAERNLQSIAEDDRMRETIRAQRGM